MQDFIQLCDSVMNNLMTWLFSFLFNFIVIRICLRAVCTSIISWLIEKCVYSIFVDKIDSQLKILWLWTFIHKFNLSIDNYQQISSTIDLSTMFLMINFDWFATSREKRKNIPHLFRLHRFDCTSQIFNLQKYILK